MSDAPSYGWISYYFNLLLLTSMSHRRRVKFIRRRAEAAEANPNPETRLRILLHSTHWPVDLIQSSSENAAIRETLGEMEALQQEMVERYEKEKLAQGRF